ncbi:MAG: four helix bundle protein [Deltaproteobacteria bacterium]|nr:four helix bundle protein [Deltaproteobacteria bacterium]
MRPRKGQDIADRLLDSIAGVKQLLPDLQRDAASRHLADQLWRAASSGGANYEEARGAESRADFVHKIRVATKELREAHYWMQVARRSNCVGPDADPLIDEFNQLIAILVASARTARSRGS